MVYPYLNYSWNGNKIVEYAPTSHNRSVCVAPPVGGLGLHSARSVACGSFPRLIAAHFASPGLCCAKPLYGPAKRRKQPERYPKQKWQS